MSKECILQSNFSPKVQLSPDMQSLILIIGRKLGSAGSVMCESSMAENVGLTVAISQLILLLKLYPTLNYNSVSATVNSESVTASDVPIYSPQNTFSSLPRSITFITWGSSTPHPPGRCRYTSQKTLQYYGGWKPSAMHFHKNVVYYWIPFFVCETDTCAIGR